MGTDDVAIVVMLAAALYEGVAHFTRKVPYITTLVNRLPWLARFGIVGGAFVWTIDHFRVLDLI